MIRLNIKLKMILQEHERRERLEADYKKKEEDLLKKSNK